MSFNYNFENNMETTSIFFIFGACFYLLGYAIVIRWIIHNKTVNKHILSWVLFFMFTGIFGIGLYYVFLRVEDMEKSRRFYSPMISSILCMLIALVFFVLPYRDKPLLQNRLAIGRYVTFLDNVWTYKSFYSTEKLHVTFAINDSTRWFIYETKIDRGSITYEIYDSKSQLVKTIQAHSGRDSLLLPFVGETCLLQTITFHFKGEFKAFVK